MSSNHFKNDLFTRVDKAPGNGNRLELLEYIAQGERSVDELANVSGLTVVNTSQHLQQLRQAGPVSCRKNGVKVFTPLAAMMSSACGIPNSLAIRSWQEVFFQTPAVIPGAINIPQMGSSDRRLPAILFIAENT